MFLTYHEWLGLNEDSSQAAGSNLFLDELHRLTDSLGIPWRDSATPRQSRNGTAVLSFSFSDLARLFLESGLSGKSVSPNINSRCRKLEANPMIKFAATGSIATKIQYFVYVGQLRKAVIGYRNSSINPSSSVEVRWDPYSEASCRQAVTEFVCRAVRNDISGYSLTSMIARGTTVPVEILAQLAGDSSMEVRRAAAWNPNTPVETLLQLASDKDWPVREAVAENPRTPVETLAQLASDDGEWVRRKVAENPNTPVKTLVELASDVDRVSDAALRSPRFTEEQREHLLELKERGLL